jgi:copper(I)-binding protein
MACALALAGCGAGQITQTSSQVSGVDGASANIGQIAVRGAEFPFTGDGKSAVVYRSGGTAPVMMSVVNFGGQPDKLTGASSPVAASVNIIGDGTVSAGKLLLVSGAPAPAPIASGSPAAAGSAASGSPAASGSASATLSAAPAAPTAALVPTAPATPSVHATPEAGSTAAAGAAPSTGPSPEGTTRAQVVLTGLKQDLQAGLTYPVVLTFQRAGEVTVEVPVGNPGEGSPA